MILDAIRGRSLHRKALIELEARSTKTIGNTLFGLPSRYFEGEVMYYGDRILLDYYVLSATAARLTRSLYRHESKPSVRNAQVGSRNHNKLLQLKRQLFDVTDRQLMFLESVALKLSYHRVERDNVVARRNRLLGELDDLLDA